MLKEVDNKPHVSFFNRIKSTLTFFGIGLLVLYTFGYLTGNCHGNKKTIIQSAFSGRIVSMKTSGFSKVGKSSLVEVNFTLTGVQEKISIKPRLNQDNIPSNFEEFAKIGDSVFKESNSEWIYIVRDGQRYGWHIPL